ncbi:MAG: hypothetical protein AAGI63_11320 [Planctomycetota bacterium]
MIKFNQVGVRSVSLSILALAFGPVVAADHPNAPLSTLQETQPESLPVEEAAAQEIAGQEATEPPLPLEISDQAENTDQNPIGDLEPLTNQEPLPPQEPLPTEDPLATPLVSPSPLGSQDRPLIGIDEVTYDLSSLPQIKGGRYQLPRLEAPTTSTKEVGNGRTPERFASQEPERALPETASQRVDDWNWTVCEWSAANTYSFPRYYEDRMLERHGHRRWGLAQPAVSGARFFGSTLMLPYLMAVRPGNEPEYTIGYYRPGSPVPGFFQRPPLDRDGVIVQSLTASGVMLIFP